MKTNTLYKLYQRYNRNFFDDLLPEPVLWIGGVDEPNNRGECDPRTSCIAIQPWLSEYDKRTVLLHEMIHMYQYWVDNLDYELSAAEWHGADFYFHAFYIHELTGRDVA